MSICVYPTGLECVSKQKLSKYKCLDMRLPYSTSFPTCCAWFAGRKSTRRPGHQDSVFSPLFSSADTIARFACISSNRIRKNRKKTSCNKRFFVFCFFFEKLSPIKKCREKKIYATVKGKKIFFFLVKNEGLIYFFVVLSSWNLKKKDS